MAWVRLPFTLLCIGISFQEVELRYIHANQKQASSVPRHDDKGKEIQNLTESSERLLTETRNSSRCDLPATSRGGIKDDSSIDGGDFGILDDGDDITVDDNDAVQSEGGTVIVERESNVKVGDKESKDSREEIVPAIVLHRCSSCNHCFPSMWELDLHGVKCTHRKASNLWYNCYLCDRSFKALGRVTNHLVIDHSVPTQEILETAPKLLGTCQPKQNARGSAVELKISEKIKKRTYILKTNSQDDGDDDWQISSHQSRSKFDNTRSGIQTRSRRSNPKIQSSKEGDKGIVIVNEDKNGDKKVVIASQIESGSSEEICLPSEINTEESLQETVNSDVHEVAEDAQESIKGNVTSLNRERVTAKAGQKQNPLELVENKDTKNDPKDESISASSQEGRFHVLAKKTNPECHLCNKKFKSLIGFMTHVKCVHFKDELRCRTCGKGYKNKQLYVRHLKSHGEVKGNEKFPCPNCDKAFTNQGFLNNHLKEHESQPKYPNYECVYCNKVLSSKGCLKKHINRSHTKEKKFICEHCNKVFYEKSHLTLHMKEHTSTRDFKCDQCNAAFYVKYQLDNHNKHVHGSEVFLCDLCGSKYKSLGSLKQHHQTVHEVDAVKLPCQVCGKLFKRVSHLNTHMKVHADVRPFKCELCTKSFRTRANLSVHMKWHNGIRSHKCSICNKSFLTKGNLDKHKQLHQDIKSHVCDECGHGYADLTSLRRHLLSVHKIHVESKVTRPFDFTKEKSLKKKTAHSKNAPKYIKPETEVVPMESAPETSPTPKDKHVTDENETVEISVSLMALAQSTHYPSEESVPSDTYAVPVSVQTSSGMQVPYTVDDGSQNIVAQAFMSMMYSNYQEQS